LAPGCAGGDLKVGRELSDHFWLVSDQTVGQSWLNLNMGSRKGLTAKNRIRIRRSVIFSLSFHQNREKNTFFQMSESEDDDNFGVFNFGDILTELQINSDAEEDDDEEDAFNQEEEDERVEETGWDDENVRFQTDEEYEIYKSEIDSGKQGESFITLLFFIKNFKSKKRCA
jgi:hypothetical protein